MAGQLKFTDRQFPGVLGETRIVPQIFRLFPRPIVHLELTDQGQFTRTQVADRAARGNAASTERARLNRTPSGVVGIDRGHIGRARQGEVAAIGAIGTFAEIFPGDHFRDQAVEVKIALTMAMGTEVHLYIVDIGREIRPVIEVEAAQKVLVGLPTARVLGGYHSRHRFKQFGNPQQGPHQQVRSGNRAFTGRLGDADLGQTASEDHNFTNLVGRSGRSDDRLVGFSSLRSGGHHGGKARRRQQRQPT